MSLMASTGTQLQVELLQPAPSPAVGRGHRWTDLGLVLMVAFAMSILSSIFRAFHLQPLNYSNAQIFLGIVDEIIPLTLLFVLLKRQNRSLKDLGFNFRWTDLPKAAGLTAAGFLGMYIGFMVLRTLYYLLTLHSFSDSGPRNDFSATSMWLILPFMFVNGFHEEVIVRGYLMTEWIELRGSAAVAAIISLLVQTSYHLYYGVFGALTIGCGLSIFALYYAKSRRLMPVVLAHILWDVITVTTRLHS
jgi:membrane protease YdiL (CAAX protease family)